MQEPLGTCTRFSVFSVAMRVALLCALALAEARSTDFSPGWNGLAKRPPLVSAYADASHAVPRDSNRLRGRLACCAPRLTPPAAPAG